MDVIDKALNQSGLSNKQSAVYRCLLELGEGAMSDIASLTGLRRTSLYYVIKEMLDTGLLTRTVDGARPRYSAVPPSQLLERLQHSTTVLERAMPFLQSLSKGRIERPKITIFQGKEEISNMISEETRCLREALYIWTGADMVAMVGGPEHMARIDRKRIRRGVRIRTIRFQHKDHPYETSAAGERFKREMRFAPVGFDPPMGVGIYDTGKVGFYSSPRESFGFIVESAELCALMKSLWRFVWNLSTPVAAGSG